MGPIIFLFVTSTETEAKHIYLKAHLWNKGLRDNICPSMLESAQLLATNGVPRHVDWFTTKVISKGLMALLEILWTDPKLLIFDLPCLVCHNDWERRASVDWLVKYEMLLIHILCWLSLDNNTWCIIAEEEAVGIELTIMGEYISNLICYCSIKPHAIIISSIPIPTCTARAAPFTTLRPTPAPTRITHSRSMCNPSVNLPLPKGTELQNCISKWLNARETLLS